MNVLAVLENETMMQPMVMEPAFPPLHDERIAVMPRSMRTAIASAAIFLNMGLVPPDNKLVHISQARRRENGGEIPSRRYWKGRKTSPFEISNDGPGDCVDRSVGGEKHTFNEGK